MEEHVEGSHVWLQENEQLIPCTITSCDRVNLMLTSDYGQVFHISQSSLSQDKVSRMAPSSVAGVEDMSTLEQLHEGAIMHNLHLRYQSQQIYTYIGSILAAVNPYQQIAGLYDVAAMKQYEKRHLGEQPPHIYAIANECYSCLWKRGGGQCVLISGESGAGKTESTKVILNFLSAMSQSCGGSHQEHTSTHVEQAIMQSSPIMEAFGNAKTIYNNNSSRFGKFIQLNFSEEGFIQGGKIIDCILPSLRCV